MIDDILLPEPLSKESLSSDMEGYITAGSKGIVNGRKRPIVDKFPDEEAEDVFDLDNNINSRV